MLSKRQNLLQTIRGGSPDRFVNQYEYLGLLYALDPLRVIGGPPQRGTTWKNAWGITQAFPEGAPGVMPVHGEGNIVITDIGRWREQIQPPSLEFPEAAWQPSTDFAAGIDRSEQFLALAMFPGLLEHCHNHMGMEQAMMAFIGDPDEMKALIGFLVDWEIAYARLLIDRLAPDALFHHDDWGSQISTLISPAMFAEFFVPAYQKLYGFYRANGIELIVHHSDSYAATLVPSMIDIGLDIWQGVMSTNNVPELIKEYGGRISFMGGIDNGKLDRADWTEESVEAEVRAVCESCGKLYFIPNTTMGGPMSTYPGLYEAVSAAIDRMSAELF